MGGDRNLTKKEQVCSSNCVMLDKIKKFLKEVRFELTKVTWTTRQELIYSTIIVIVVSIILSIFIGIVDLGLSNLATMLLG